MRKIIFSLFFTLSLLTFGLAQSSGLLIDDFEGTITGGMDGTVDFGAGNGSSVEVSAATVIKNTGNQSLKVAFDAVSGGYMWVARGFVLDVINAGWFIKPEDINWNEYNAIS